MLSAPTITLKTTSLMKTKLILGNDSPRETLTAGITSISPTPSSITPTNTMVSATSAASETTLESTTTNIYTTFTATEPHSSTAAATCPGKMAVTPSHAIPGKLHLVLKRHFPSVSHDRDDFSEHSQFSNTSLFSSSHHNTFTLAMRMRPSSPPAPNTESVSTWSTNTTPTSTLITTLPTTHDTSTPISPTSPGTMATTEITTPPNVSTTVTLNTASLPPSSTPETTTMIVVTTPMPTMPHRRRRRRRRRSHLFKHLL
ncbi:mucin-3A-like [Mustela nigripes]|uniref:mucin-3A-like n=1 Tax=Mustela nigripes TaxID=77151 RepID=UPI0028166519|nr:mucin-3A-like [Mustela nigripes]